MRPLLTIRKIAAVFVTTLLTACGDGDPTGPPLVDIDGVFAVVGFGSSGGVLTSDLWVSGNHVYAGSL